MRAERTLIMPSILAAAALAGRPMGSTARMSPEGCIPAPSVDSIMEGLLEPTPSEGSPAWAASTEAVASMEEAVTEAVAGDRFAAGDSSMKREMMNTINRYIRRLSKRAGPALISFAIPAVWATFGAYPGLAHTRQVLHSPFTESTGLRRLIAVT